MYMQARKGFLRALALGMIAVISACGGNSDSCSLFCTCGGEDDGGSSTQFLGASACQAIGYSNAPKVANGEECPIASANDSSSVVALLISKGDKTGLCTGTVVAPNTVLTAAHCFLGGATSVQVITTVKGKRYATAARTAMVHPRFGVSGSVLFNDVAIVKTAKNLSTPITPILLSRSPSEDEESLVAGYGQTENNGDAQANVNAGRAIVDDVSDNHIFIDYTRSQAHPCKGDSGGALFVSSGQGIAVVGVVSQSDPSIDVEDICEVGDRTLYTSLREPSVAAFLRQNIPNAIFQ